jgi:hypothetical protein
MTSRERNLAIIMGVLLLVGVAFIGWTFLAQPLMAKHSQTVALEAEVLDLQKQADDSQKLAPKLAEAKRRSLPADPKAAAARLATQAAAPQAGAPATAVKPESSSTARLEYSMLLGRLLERAKIPVDSITVKEKTADARGIPVLPNKRPAYTRVIYDVDVRNVDLWEIHDFLTGYYQVDLLHQITSLTIKREEGAQAAGKKDRKDLTLNMTTEAILLDGAEPRPNLVPIPSAFAAVGGWPGYDAIAFNANPNPARLINPFRTTPLLAPSRRDYSLIVLRDMFHGPLPPPPPPGLGEVKTVYAQVGTPVPPVKLTPTGEWPAGPVVWEVQSDGGRVLPLGSVKVDPAKQTVSVTPARDEVGNGMVSVVAKLPDGKVLKTSFVVSVTPVPVPPSQPQKDEISAYIFLVNTTLRSDGTGSAVIRDRFNPHDYEIEVTPKEGTKVRKYWYPHAEKKDLETITPLLVIGDDNTSSTRRTFKVVALDSEGLVVMDMTLGHPTGSGPSKSEKGGPPQKGGPPKGPPAAAPKPGEPIPVRPSTLAAAGGGPAAVVPTGAPKLYRWGVGKSLKQLAEIPKDEADRILQRAEKTGPLGATAGTAEPPVDAAPTPAEVMMMTDK